MDQGRVGGVVVVVRQDGSGVVGWVVNFSSRIWLTTTTTLPNLANFSSRMANYYYYTTQPG